MLSQIDYSKYKPRVYDKFIQNYNPYASNQLTNTAPAFHFNKPAPPIDISRYLFTQQKDDQIPHMKTLDDFNNYNALRNENMYLEQKKFNNLSQGLRTKLAERKYKIMPPTINQPAINILKIKNTIKKQFDPQIDSIQQIKPIYNNEIEDLIKKLLRISMQKKTVRGQLLKTKYKKRIKQLENLIGDDRKLPQQKTKYARASKILQDKEHNAAVERLNVDAYNESRLYNRK